GDVKEFGLDRPVRDEVYIPLLQAGGFTGNVVVRTAMEPAAISSAIRSAIREIDSQLAVDQMITIEDLQADSVASPPVPTSLLGLFAGLAFIISATGIAGTMALTVSQRTNELGIRMALGASRGAVIGAVVRQGLVLAFIGTILGLAGALAMTRLLSALL